jgi:hypothetical protein
MESHAIPHALSPCVTTTLFTQRGLLHSMPSHAYDTRSSVVLFTMSFTFYIYRCLFHCRLFYIWRIQTMFVSAASPAVSQLGHKARLGGLGGGGGRRQRSQLQSCLTTPLQRTQLYGPIVDLLPLFISFKESLGIRNGLTRTHLKNFFWINKHFSERRIDIVDVAGYLWAFPPPLLASSMRHRASLFSRSLKYIN